MGIVGAIGVIIIIITIIQFIDEVTCLPSWKTIIGCIFVFLIGLFLIFLEIIFYYTTGGIYA